MRTKKKTIFQSIATAERRAADLAHRDRIHAEIVEALNNEGCPHSNAVNVVMLLATGVIPHVRITY